MTRQFVVFGTAVMTTLLALVVLWQFHIVVVYVLISLALAATVRPFVKYWTGRGFVTRLVLILLYLVGLGSFGFLIFFVGKFAISDIQQLTRTLSVQGTWRLPPWLEGSSFQYALIARLPTPDKLFEAVTGRTRSTCSTRRPRLHEGRWRYCERRIRRSVPQSLLEHQSNSF